MQFRGVGTAMAGTDSAVPLFSEYYKNNNNIKKWKSEDNRAGAV